MRGCTGIASPYVNFTSMVDLTAFTREDQNEAIESVLNTYAVRYGDDYAASGWGCLASCIAIFLWIGNIYLDDSGRDSPASLNSTGDM